MYATHLVLVHYRTTLIKLQQMTFKDNKKINISKICNKILAFAIGNIN